MNYVHAGVKPTSCPTCPSLFEANPLSFCVILEGIVTTINDDDSVNISPMGPMVDTSMSTLTLRPYQTSTTYQNLRRVGQGIFHVTDDVELLARAAVSRLEGLPKMRPASAVTGMILVDACRWYAFEVSSLDDREDRTTIQCKIVDRGRQRDFLGFNRAKHAVVEAAILATRTQFLPADEILAEFERLGMIVDKTAGEQERVAFDFLKEFVCDELC